MIRTTLNYAGDIQGRARFDVPDPSSTNLVLASHEVELHDVRSCGRAPSLDGEGFAFVKHEMPVALLAEIREANLTHQRALGAASLAYQQALGDFIRRLTGAREVVAQSTGLIVRTSERAATRSWALPAAFVHLDYTARSAAQFRDWSLAHEGRVIAPFRRMAVFQTWRAISPAPQDSLLAVCDGSTVPPEDAIVMDAVVGPEGEPGAFFESRLCRHRASHRWLYLSDMAPDDLIVFKGFDSDVPAAMNAMHTAFANPLAGPDAVPRESIEARFFAFFD